MKNTGVMCVVAAHSAGDDIRHIDLGNYHERRGQRVLVTSIELAKRYGHLVDVPIFVRKTQRENKP